MNEKWNARKKNESIGEKEKNAVCREMRGTEINHVRQDNVKKDDRIERLCERKGAWKGKIKEELEERRNKKRGSVSKTMKQRK